MKKKIKKHLLKIHPFINLSLKKLFRFQLSEDTFLKLAKHYSVSIASVFINYTIFSLLFFSNFGLIASNTTSLLAVFLIAFALQRNFTYRSNGSMPKQFFWFAVCAASYILIGNYVLKIMTEQLGIYAMVSKMMTIALLAPLNFLFQKKVVFNSNHSELSGYLNKYNYKNDKKD